MQNPLPYLLNLMLLIVLFGLGAACSLEEPYEPCGLPQQQEELCIPQPTDSEEQVNQKKTANCKVVHPQCPGEYCVSFKGSSGFCSEACRNDSDCQEGGSCIEFTFDCVLDEDGNRTCLNLCVKKSLAK